MYTSYALSERVNFQTLIWDIAGAVWTVCKWFATIYSMLLMAMQMVAPHIATMGKALLLAAVLVGVVAVVAMLPLQLWLGLGIVAAYAFVFKPRGK